MRHSPVKTIPSYGLHFVNEAKKLLFLIQIFKNYYRYVCVCVSVFVSLLRKIVKYF